MPKRTIIPVFIFLLPFLGIQAQTSHDHPDYLNTRLSFEQRAADLVARMSLEEKIMQMQNEAF